MGRLVLDEAIADAKLRQSIYLAIPPEKLRAAIEEAKTLGTPNGYYDFLDDHSPHSLYKKSKHLISGGPELWVDRPLSP
jgi:hypothetical protein